MSNLQAWLDETLLELNLTDTMELPQGFSRLSFTDEEKRAHAVFRQIAKELGLKVSQDEAGNQWAIWETDPHAPIIAMGSHLDTVYGGGGYDGAAGVLAALAAVKELKDSGFTPEKNIAVICFISEESARFAVSTVGSKAVAGTLDKEELANLEDKDGITFKTAVQDFDLDWDTLEKAEVAPEKIEQFIELHIEQGTILEKAGAEIGVVQGIACPVRLKVRVKGQANHTGTTPMGERKDAFVAGAPLVNFVQEEAEKWNEESDVPLVATVSTVQLSPNAMNVIPGEVEFGIDIRSVNDKLKRGFAEAVQAFCREIEVKHPVTVEVETIVNNDSVLLDEGVHDRLKEAGERAGMKTLSMNSGAGHDVMNMAQRWPSGLIFIPCRDGLSHHPEEHAEISDIEKGVRVMVDYLKNEAGKKHELSCCHCRAA